MVQVVRERGRDHMTDELDEICVGQARGAGSFEILVADVPPFAHDSLGKAQRRSDAWIRRVAGACV